MSLFKCRNILICDFNFSFLVIFFFLTFFLFIILLTYIALIRQDYYIHIASTMFFDFFKPAIYIIKTVFICQIKYNKNYISSFIICLSNSTVSFLSRSIPYLKPYRTFINLQSPKSKIYSNSCYIVFLEFIIRKSY